MIISLDLFTFYYENHEKNVMCHRNTLLHHLYIAYDIKVKSKQKLCIDIDYLIQFSRSFISF